MNVLKHFVQTKMESSRGLLKTLILDFCFTDVEGFYWHKIVLIKHCLPFFLSLDTNISG